MVYHPQPVARPAKPRSGRERRMSVRFLVGRKSSVSALLELGESTLTAAVHDVSSAGIGLWLEQKLEPGLVFSVQLFNSSHLFHCSRLLRVAHSQMEDNGQYLIGCEFSTALAYDQLQALLW